VAKIVGYRINQRLFMTLSFWI